MRHEDRGDKPCKTSRVCDSSPAPSSTPPGLLPLSLCTTSALPPDFNGYVIGHCERSANFPAVRDMDDCNEHGSGVPGTSRPVRVHVVRYASWSRRDTGNDDDGPRVDIVMKNDIYYEDLYGRKRRLYNRQIDKEFGPRRSRKRFTQKSRGHTLETYEIARFFFLHFRSQPTLVLLTGYGEADSPALGTRRNRFLREPVVSASNNAFSCFIITKFLSKPLTTARRALPVRYKSL